MCFHFFTLSLKGRQNCEKNIFRTYKYKALPSLLLKLQILFYVYIDNGYIIFLNNFYL